MDRVRLSSPFRLSSGVKPARPLCDGALNLGAALLEHAEYDQDEGGRGVQLLDEPEAGLVALRPCFFSLGGLSASVVGRMIALVLLLFVKFPILLKITTRSQGSETQDGFGSRQAPASSGQLHPVLDEMPTRALDDTGGDWQPHRKILIISQIGSVTEQIVTAAVDCLTGLSVQLTQCGTTPDATSDCRALTAQDP